MNVGKNLQIIREVNDFTQNHVADFLGISQKSYSNLERAKNNVSVEVLLKLSELYKINVLKFLELNTEMIFNNNTQNGGVGYINNLANLYSGEKENYQLLLSQQSALIDAQQTLINDLTIKKTIT